MRPTQAPDAYNLDQRVEALGHLGRLLWQARPEDHAEVFAQASAANPFFTPAQIVHALHEWGNHLTITELQAWLAPYRSHLPLAPKTVLLVLAGNLPLVGFHDYLCVLLAGCRPLIKLSSKDAALLPYFHQQLRKNAPLGSGLNVEESDPVRFVSEIPTEGFAAVIATGSDPSHAFFSRKFHHLPHLLRHSRHACAILQGHESHEELRGLADDISLYFGMGCRSVSKLYVPKNYDFHPLIAALAERGDELRQNTAYMHAYAGQKALMTVNGESFLDTGFLLLAEKKSPGSPQGVLHYQTYRSLQEVEAELLQQQENLQCVVGQGHLPFGAAQRPALCDYADGADTLGFLSRYLQRRKKIVSLRP